MADQLDKILDPYPIAPLFVHFPTLNAPAPAPLASTHCQQRAHVSVWRNSPSVASTGPIKKKKLEHLKIRHPGAMDAGIAR
jgi:hypothetical protein